MKRMAIAAVGLFLILASAGCSPGQELGALSVRNSVTGEVITIGDARSDAESITGSDAATILTDTLYDIERISYHDRPGIELGYRDDKVVSIHLTQYDPTWEIAGGVHANMKRAEVERHYADNPLRQTGEKGGVLLGYGEDLAPVACDAGEPNATPYTLRISYSLLQDDEGNEISGQYGVGIIAIEDTAPYRQPLLEA